MLNNTIVVVSGALFFDIIQAQLSMSDKQGFGGEAGLGEDGPRVGNR